MRAAQCIYKASLVLTISYRKFWQQISKACGLRRAECPGIDGTALQVYGYAHGFLPEKVEKSKVRSPRMPIDCKGITVNCNEIRGVSMNNLKGYTILLILVGGLAAFLGARARVWANPQESGAAVVADLSQMLRAPLAYNRQRVAFQCRFAATGSLYRDSSDFFTPQTHDNFAIWPAEAHLWDRNSRRNILPSLYLPKTSTLLCSVLRKLPRYTKIEITGTIVTTYANLPWIEVENIRLLPDEGLSEEMLVEIARGLELLQSDNPAAAEVSFNSALRAGAPDYVTAFVNARLSACRQALQPQVAQTAPKSLLERAEAAASEGRIGHALDLYDLAAQNDSNLRQNKAFNTNIGLLYLRSEQPHRFSKAKEHLDLAHAADGSDQRVLLALAQIAAHNRAYAAAEEYAGRTLEIDPENTAARRLLAEVMSERLSNERDAARQAPASAPVHITAQSVRPEYLELGREKLGRGDFAGAEHDLRLALSVDATEQAVRNLLASALLAQGKSTEAQLVLSGAPLPESAHGVVPQGIEQELKVEALQEEFIEEMSAEPLAVPAVAATIPAVPTAVTGADFGGALSEMNRLQKELESISPVHLLEPADKVSTLNSGKDTPVQINEFLLPQAAPLPQTPAAPKNTAEKKPAPVKANDITLPDVAPAAKSDRRLPDWAQ